MFTERDSKIGRCQGGAPNLGQALAGAEAAKLPSLAMQAGPKFGGCPTLAPGPPKNASFFGEKASAEPIFESRAVLLVGVLGLNFKTADLVLREAMARGAQSLADQRAIFFRHAIVVLSTCNRTEIYFSGADLAEVHSHILSYLRDHIEVPFEHRLYSYFGIDCLTHLCRVTAGLDSALIAETEIQRQVKLAYMRSTEWVSLPSSLHYLFQKALKVGKVIRHAMGALAKRPTLFERLWGMADWKKGKILLVGHSQINRSLVAFLLYRGVKNLSLCTQNPWKVLMHGVQVYDRQILERWPEFELIVCASQAAQYLITGQGSERNLLFDLSVPRNIDPAVGQTARLYNIDELIQPKGTPEYLDQCEALLQENVHRLYHCYAKKVAQSA